MKKMPGDVIILHKCTKNHDHMLYCLWDIVCDRYYFSFWAIFCPFTPLTTEKIKILKKWKKRPGESIISQLCTKNYDQMMYSSWDMVCNRWTDGWTDGKSDIYNIERLVPPPKKASTILFELKFFIVYYNNSLIKTN